MAYCEKCKCDIGSDSLEKHLLETCNGLTFIDLLVDVIKEGTKNQDKNSQQSTPANGFDKSALPQ